MTFFSKSFYWLCHTAFGILVLQPGIKPMTLALEAHRFFCFLRFFGRPFFFFFLHLLLNLLQYCFGFMFFDCKAGGILAPRPGIKPTSPALEGKVLTTGPPGKPHQSQLCWRHFWCFGLSISEFPHMRINKEHYLGNVP